MEALEEKLVEKEQNLLTVLETILIANGSISIKIAKIEMEMKKFNEAKNSLICGYEVELDLPW